MYELIEHPAYAVIRQYPHIVIDYVVLQNDTGGSEWQSHQQAALAGMGIIKQRVARECGSDWVTIAPDKMRSSPMAAQFFQAVDCHHLPGGQHSNRTYGEQAINLYAEAFLFPPHNSYCTIADFIAVNNALFSAPDQTEIYSWNSDWSNYFEAGLVLCAI